MSSCRATSFYLAPGVLRYFKDHTLAAVLPDGSWLEIKHRGDIARFKQEHALWDGTILCGPRQQGGLGELRSHIAADGSTVEVWNIDDRVIEGRRPENAAAYALHRWAVTGDTQAVGGVRQLIEVVAPGAPRSVRNALQEAALRGEHHAVDVVAAAWRAGLLRNPDQIVELLKHSRIPFRSVPDPRLEQLLRGVVATGRTVDAVVFISGMIDGSHMLDAGTGQLLARDTATSSVVLHVLALDGNYETRKEVACNPNTPGDTLLLLAKDEDEGIRRYVAKNPNTTSAALLQLANDEAEDVPRYVAEHPNTPAAAFLQLAQNGSLDVMHLVARNPNTPVAVLEQLSQDGYSRSVRLYVAQNPGTPAAALLQLAKDKDEDVRYCVAEHSNTPAAALLQLSQDGSMGVMRLVAQNPNTPAAALLQLATSEADDRRIRDVRSAVAGNPNTPVAVLELLSKDLEESARLAVALNPNTPVAVLERLATSEAGEWRGEYVRSAVALNPNTPVALLEQLAVDQHERVRTGVASNPNTPVAVLGQLSKDYRGPGVIGASSADVIRAVALNPNTPVALLEQLATSTVNGRREARVLSAVALNTNTPVAALAQLSNDGSDVVQRSVAGNPNTPVAALERLATSEAGEWRGQYVRSAVALNPSTPVATLVQLSNDPSDEVQRAVKQNPNTPVAIERIVQSTNRDAGDWLGSHTDRYEHHAIKNGIPLELHTTSDLAYHELVRYGAPVVDYPDVIRAVSDVGRENISFRFSDDTLKLRHTFAESTVQVAESTLTPRVISSPRALRENANYMGNCTAGYEGGIRRDESLIIALDDTSSASRDTLYNVEIQRGSGDRWDTIGEINSRFNQGVTDDEQLAIIDQLTKLLGKT